MDVFTRPLKIKQATVPQKSMQYRKIFS